MHFEDVVLALFWVAFILQTLFGDMVIPYDKVRLLLHPIFGKFHSAFEHNEEVFWLRKKKTWLDGMLTSTRYLSRLWTSMHCHTIAEWKKTSGPLKDKYFFLKNTCWQYMCMMNSKQIVACISLYSKLTYLINNRRAANIFYHITNVEVMLQ